MGPQEIIVRGARQHNLQGIDVVIPKNALVVVTGPSGSGKSSLAFDTLYAEGQRRYVESLSAYARQFLDRLEKPDVDSIEGLSPAIAIEQKSSAPNPRSTIATATEIWDYLRVLWAAAGVPHDPDTGAVLKRHTPGGIGDFVLGLGEGVRVLVLAPVRVGTRPGKDLAKLSREGFLRVWVGGEVREIEAIDPAGLEEGQEIELVVDRLVVRGEGRGRVVESVETALQRGRGEMAVAWQEEREGGWERRVFHTSYRNPETGFVMGALTPKHFSFNGHLGACEACHGLGVKLVASRQLLVPDESLSISGGAIKGWWVEKSRLGQVMRQSIDGLARHHGVDRDAAFRSLSVGFKEALFGGSGEELVPTGWATGAHRRSVGRPFEGLCAGLERAYVEAGSDLARARARRLMEEAGCAACGGRRLKPEILAVSLAGAGGERAGIAELGEMSVRDAAVWMAGLRLEGVLAGVCAEVVTEVRKRLDFLLAVGLGYLGLDRRSGSLSGGEAQRIRLATQIGGGLSGVLYVLDEPTIGLHPRDTERLVGTLERLRDLGNTLVVVEHDEVTMRRADWIIDIGPGAGPAGGRLVAAGRPEDVMALEASATGAYLSGRRSIAVPARRAAVPGGVLLGLDDGGREGWLTVHGAREHNLRGIDVAFPAGCLSCVTGASGSGKSTLVDGILRRVLARHFGGGKDLPGAHDRVTGLGQFDKAIVVDQSPIGRSPRSNPATYVGVFTEIRKLFAGLPAAKVRGYDAGRFSFNRAGGRCEVCQGDGLLRIDMHFLSDVYVSCEACGGRRYMAETLEVTYRGRSIADVLEMDAEEAARLFIKVPKIAGPLRSLCAVGLGYVKLGQSATTLSGGEAQRVKLATELARKMTGRTLYLFDEPTTGLHFSDVEVLLDVFRRLRDAGNTLIVIEHHLDVIKSADWVIDLGPGGGDEGGAVVVAGRPEDVAACVESETGRYLAGVLGAVVGGCGDG